MVVTGPIDQLQADHANVVRKIRRHVESLKASAALWEPRPMPSGWGQQ